MVTGGFVFLVPVMKNMEIINNLTTWYLFGDATIAIGKFWCWKCET